MLPVALLDSPRRRRVGPSALLITLLLLAMNSGSCSGAKPAKPNIIVLVADTLRADRVGAYGHPGGLSPFIDTLAGRGIVFERAYAPSSWTLPSVASLLTSRFPSQHGVRTVSSVLPADAVTLPELLSEAGYATAAFTANTSMTKRHGLAQGYQVYRNLPMKGGMRIAADAFTAPASAVNRLALQWLNTVSGQPHKPFFLYLQYMETHLPYQPPADLLPRFFAGRDAAAVARANAAPFAGAAIPDDLLLDLRDLYDLQVHALDREIEALFRELGKRQLLNDTLVVFTADHGEGLNDHGYLTHGSSLFEEEIRIPWIVVVPGQRHQIKVTQAVNLVDLAPSLLDWAGVPIPPSFEGRSRAPLFDRASGSLRAWLRSLWDDPDRAGEAVVIELPGAPFATTAPSPKHRHAVISGPEKMIADRGTGREYYDLERDPHERNADALGPEQRSGLESALAAFERGLRSTPAAAPLATMHLDEKTRESLRQLGYLPE